MGRGLTLLFAIVTACGLAWPALATAPADADPALDPALPIRQAIELQLAAFNADDRDMAFSLTAPSIQRLFGNAEKFGDMVGKQYAQIRRSTGAAFLELRRMEVRFVQRVRIMGDDGRIVHANYVMVRLNDGAWRIGSVFLDKADREIEPPALKLGPPPAP